MDCLPSDLQMIVFQYSGKNRWPRPPYIWEIRRFFAWREVVRDYFCEKPEKMYIKYWEMQESCRNRNREAYTRIKYADVLLAIRVGQRYSWWQ